MCLKSAQNYNAAYFNHHNVLKLCFSKPGSHRLHCHEQCQVYQCHATLLHLHCSSIPHIASLGHPIMKSDRNMCLKSERCFNDLVSNHPMQHRNTGLLGNLHFREYIYTGLRESLPITLMSHHFTWSGS